MSPTHSPVENPFQSCGADSGGCGRPSIQISRSYDLELSSWTAVIMRVIGSTSFQILTSDGPRQMLSPCIGRHCQSGSDSHDPLYASALLRAALLMGIPR